MHRQRINSVKQEPIDDLAAIDAYLPMAHTSTLSFVAKFITVDTSLKKINDNNRIILENQGWYPENRLRNY